jgi:YjbE family integral membrane protein
MTLLDPGSASALIQVILIDVTLAGDNAIVVGIVAGSLEGRDRQRAIIAGVVFATALRIGLALVASRFLAIVGLTLAGGLLLLWVAWKMFREIAGEHRQVSAVAAAPPVASPGSMRSVMLRIVVADVSMSVDNVLAVAGTAREHVWVLVAGLGLSVALMGIASTLVARLLGRWPWIVWIGLAIITYVAVSMIFDGWREVGAHLSG